MIQLIEKEKRGEDLPARSCGHQDWNAKSIFISAPFHKPQANNNDARLNAPMMLSMWSIQNTIKTPFIHQLSVMN
jgi:hypothetical protein